MKRKEENQELEPVRTIRVKCCHVCGAACGQIMCGPCGDQHAKNLAAMLARILMQPNRNRPLVDGHTGRQTLTLEKQAELAREHAEVRKRYSPTDEVPS